MTETDEYTFASPDSPAWKAAAAENGRPLRAMAARAWDASRAATAKTAPVTPGQALHDSLRESAATTPGLLASDFATWDQVPRRQRDRLENAARDVIAASDRDVIAASDRDVLDRALHIAAHEAEMETADAEAARERWLAEARLQESLPPIRPDGLVGIPREEDDEARDEAELMSDAASLDADFGSDR